MELEEIVKEAKTRNGLSQNELASRIGMNKQNLSAVLHGRRKLPAEAAIELFDLTGIHPKEILKASMRIASSVMLFVILFLHLPEKAEANQYVTKDNKTEYTLSRIY